MHWDSAVIMMLHARVQDMVLQDQLNAQASVSVLWSIAKLSDRFSIPSELLAALVKYLPTKMAAMNPRDLSNCFLACAKLREATPVVLDIVPVIASGIVEKTGGINPQDVSNNLWVSARLKDVGPEVLRVVPAMAAQIPDKVKDMVPQGLANCLWACAELKNAAPVALKVVPDILAEVPVKISEMKPQELSNTLEALVFLQSSVPEVAEFVAGAGSKTILRCAATRISILLPRLKGKDLSIAVPAAVWACAKAGVHHSELLASVAQHFGSQTNKLQKLPNFALCALSWSYGVLDATDDFQDFQKLLISETRTRGFSEADVKSCELGHLQWNHAKLQRKA